MKQLVIALGLLTLFGASCAEQGAATPQAAATNYLSAARRGDVPALVALAPGDYDARSEAQAKVAAYALLGNKAIEITYRPNDITPDELSADLTATDGAFRDTIHVQRMGSRWFVILGRSKNPQVPGSTAQASPSVK